jgi:DNA-binding transcriptional LysR family regulator
VRASAAGERLYAEARRLLAQAELIAELMDQLQPSSKPVRLAASHTAAEYLLPALLKMFADSAEREHLAVELISANSSVVCALLLDGRADLGLCALPPAGQIGKHLSAELFCEDEVVVAVPTSHPWARRKQISLKEFLTTAMVMRDPTANTRVTVESVLGARNLTASPPLAEVGSTAAAKAAARAENAPVLISTLSLTVGDFLVAVPVASLQFKRSFAVITADSQELHHAAQTLSQFLTAHTSTASE